MSKQMTVNEEDELLCAKCGEEIEINKDDNVADMIEATQQHKAVCPGPEHRGGKLAACPFCGSKDVDPEGWMSGGCRCPDAAAHEIMQCETRTGPYCDDCGATAGSVESWNRRVIA